MVYKKYIKRDGKVYGPYLYHNVKKDGRVITTYHGKTDEKKHKHNSFFSKLLKPNRNFYLVVLFLVFLIAGLIINLAFLLNLAFTGKVSVNFQDVYQEGDNLAGDLSLVLKHGEFYPADSVMIVDNVGEVNSYSLADLINEDLYEGSFYVEGTNISGYGLGVGVPGEKVIYPTLTFAYKIVDKNITVVSGDTGEGEVDTIIPKNETNKTTVEEENKTELPINETLEPENETIEPENVTVDGSAISSSGGGEVNSEEPSDIVEIPIEPSDETQDIPAEDTIPVETPEVSETGSEGQDTSVSSESSSEEDSSTSTSSESSSEGGSDSGTASPSSEGGGESIDTGITGGVITEDEGLFYGNVSYNVPFESIVGEGKEIEIVYSITPLDIEYAGSRVIVTTDYSEVEEGYGEDYLIDENYVVPINFNDLGIVAKTGLLTVTFFYQDTTIVSISKEIEVINVTNQTNLTLADSFDLIVADKNFKIDKKVKDKFLSKNGKVRVLAKVKPGEKSLGSKLGDTDYEVIDLDIETLALLGDEVLEIAVDQSVDLFLSDSEEIIRSSFVRENFGLNGLGKSICIIDSGADSGVINYKDGWDFVDNDSTPEDLNGHGTEVAYVIQTIAPGSDIYVAKVVDEGGNGYESDVLMGLDWCIKKNVDIISFSIGAGSFDGICDNNFVATLANDAVDLGTFVVAATGNDGSSLIASPACASGVVSVGSTDKKDKIASFSNINEGVDVLAPGKNIDTVSSLGRAVTVSGTSMSAPMVAGAGAIVLENESLIPSELRDRFKTTGLPVEYNSVNISRLDVYNAVVNNITMNLSGFIMNETNMTNETLNFSIFSTNYTVDPEPNVFAMALPVDPTYGTERVIIGSVDLDEIQYTDAAMLVNFRGTSNVSTNYCGFLLCWSGVSDCIIVGNVTRDDNVTFVDTPWFNVSSGVTLGHGTHYNLVVQHGNNWVGNRGCEVDWATLGVVGPIDPFNFTLSPSQFYYSPDSKVNFTCNISSVYDIKKVDLYTNRTGGWTSNLTDILFPENESGNYNVTQNILGNYAVKFKPNATYGIDVEIESGKSNQGSQTLFTITDGDPSAPYNNGRALLWFNLSKLSKYSNITDAKLKIYKGICRSYGSTDTINVYRVTRAWVENQANWTHASSSVAWTNPGGDYFATGSSVSLEAFCQEGNISIDLKNMVTSIVNGTYSNYGFIILLGGNPDTVDIPTSDYSSASLWPELTVNFSDRDKFAYSLDFDPGAYKWNCFAEDVMGYKDSHTANYSIFITPCAPPTGQDWKVSGNCVIEGGNLGLSDNKNINITSTGSLTLIDTDLALRPIASNGSARISIEAGGKLNITQGSRIYASGTNNRYGFNFSKGIVFASTNSELEDFGWMDSPTYFNDTLSEFSGNYIHDFEGIVLVNTSNKIISNHFANSRSNTLSRVGNNSIVFNNFFENITGGVYIDAFAGRQSIRVNVSYNNFTRYSSYALFLYDTYQSLVDNNRFYSPLSGVQGGLLFFSGQAVGLPYTGILESNFTNNYFEGHSSAGISRMVSLYGQNNLFSGNVFQNNSLGMNFLSGFPSPLLNSWGRDNVFINNTYDINSSLINFTLINSTFNESKLRMSDSGNLSSFMYLGVYVQDDLGSPLDGVAVNIYNASGILVASTSTNNLGMSPYQLLKSFYMNTTGIYRSYPYSVNLTYQGSITGAFVNLTNSTNITFSFDLHLPQILNFSFVGDPTPNPYFNVSYNFINANLWTDEFASCRMSYFDESYRDMADDYNCTYVPSGADHLHFCGQGTVGDGIYPVFFSCSDPSGNNHTAENNNATFIQVDTTRPYVKNFVSVGDAIIEGLIPSINNSLPMVVFNVSEDNITCYLSTDATDQSYDSMADDLLCNYPGGSGADKLFECNFSYYVPLPDGLDILKVACKDYVGNKPTILSQINNTTVEVDTLRPVKSDFTPFNGSKVRVGEFNVTLNLSEAGSCRWNDTPLSYDEMISGCSFGKAQTSIICPIDLDVAPGDFSVYIACSDDTEYYPNMDSATTATYLNFSIDPCYFYGESVVDINGVLTCGDTNINMTPGSILNVNNGGRLELSRGRFIFYRVNVSDGGFMYVKDAKQTIWINNNLTISGGFALDNATLRMNTTTTNNCSIGINVSSTGSLMLNNSANITTGSTNRYRYMLNTSSGSNLSMNDSVIEYAGCTTNSMRSPIIRGNLLSFNNNLFTYDVGPEIHSSVAIISNSNFSRNADRTLLLFSPVCNVTNSTFSNSLQGGLYLGCSNSNFSNINIINTSGGALSGMQVTGSNNIFNNLLVKNNDQGIYLNGPGNKFFNSLFVNNTICTAIFMAAGDNKGIYFYDSTFENCTTYDFDFQCYKDAEAYCYEDYVFLTNVSYNKSNTNFYNTTSGLHSNSTLVVRWNVDVKTVDRLGRDVSSIFVEAYDVDHVLSFNGMSNSTGDLIRQNLTEYTESNKSGILYLTPYNLTGSSLDYKFYSQNFNFTNNTLFTLVMSDEGVPEISFVSPTKADNSFTNLSYSIVNVSINDTDTPENVSGFINLDSSLISWWPFEGTTPLNELVHPDYSGNDWVLTEDRGDPTLIDGVVGKAINFVPNNAVISDYNFPDPNDSSYSISFWMKRGQSSSNSLVLTKGYNNLTDNFIEGLLFRVSSTDNRLYFGVGDGVVANYVLTFENSATTDNLWHHYVGVIDRDSNEVRLYVDGVQQTDVDDISGIGKITKHYTFTVGAGNIDADPTNYGAFFNGSIDELMVFNRSLDDKEIASLYNSFLYPLDINYTGLYEGIHNYTAYARDISGNFNATENRSLIVDLTAPKINFIPNTPEDNAYFGGNYFEINHSIIEKYLGKVIFNTNGTNTTLYDSSLVLAVNFDNLSSIGESDSVVKDISFGQRSGRVINGALPISSGKHDGAYSFDGINDLVDFGNDAGLNIGAHSNSMAISAWINMNAAPVRDIIDGGNRIVSKDNLISSEYLFGVYLDSGKAKLVYGTFPNLMINNVGSSIPLDSGQWYHVAVVKNDTHVTFYVNGSIDSVISYSNNIEFSSGYNLSIGGLYGASGLSFNGMIDDVRLWNRSLNPAEMNTVYQSSFTKYDSETYILTVNRTEMWPGHHTYYAAAYDLAGNFNITEERRLDLNYPPVVELLQIGPALAHTRDDLYCLVNVTDPDTALINVSIGWYKGGVKFKEENFTDYIPGTLIYSNISHTFTNSWDQIRCGVYANDDMGGVATNLTNSLNINVYDTFMEIGNETGKTYGEPVYFQANYTNPVYGKIGEIMFHQFLNGSEGYIAGHNGVMGVTSVDFEGDGFFDDAFFNIADYTEAEGRGKGYAYNGSSVFGGISPLWNKTFAYSKQSMPGDYYEAGVFDTVFLIDSTGGAQYVILNSSGGVLPHDSVSITAMRVMARGSDANGNIYFGAGNVGVFAFYSNGTKKWSNSYSSSGRVPREIEPFDYDGDGYRDEVLVFYSDDNLPVVVVLFDDVGNYVWDYTGTGLYRGNTFGLAVGDVDNDGSDDFVFKNKNDLGPEIGELKYFNRSLISILNVSTTSLLIDRAYEIEFADIDDDGNEDDVVLTDSSGLVALQDGVLQGGLPYFDSSQYLMAHNLVVDDFNDDGKSDYVIYGYDNSTLVLDHSFDGPLLNFSGFASVGSDDRNSFGDSAVLDPIDANSDGVNDLIFGDGLGESFIVQIVNCSVVFNDSESGKFVWDVVSQSWLFYRVFPTSGLYEYNITCRKGGYLTKVEEGFIEVLDNMPPTVDYLNILPQPFFYTGDDLTCSVRALDNEQTKLHVNFSWYVNGENVLNQSIYNLSVVDHVSEYGISNLTYNYTKHGDVINCTVDVTDGVVVVTNSTAEQVSEYPATLSLFGIGGVPAQQVKITADYHSNIIGDIGRLVWESGDFDTADQSWGLRYFSVDGKRKDDISVGNSSGFLGYNDSDSLVWYDAVSSQIKSAIRVADIDNDSVQEIVGLYYWDGHIIVMYPNNGSVKMNIDPLPTSQYPQMSALEIGDIDGDGVDDIIAGGLNTVFPNLFAFNGSGNLIWSNSENNGWYRDLGFVDFDKDGVNDYLAAVTLEEIIIIDLSDGSNIWSRTLGNGVSGGKDTIYSLVVEDFDDDGFNDVATADWRSNDERVRVYNVSNNVELWNYVLTSGSPSNNSCCGIDAMDVNGDGKMDVILGGSMYISAIGNGGSYLWTKYVGINFQNNVNSLTTDDISDDRDEEVIYGSGANHLFVLNGSGDRIFINNLTKGLIGPESGNSESLDVSDFNGDGIGDVAALTSVGKIYVFQDVNCSIIFNDTLITYPMDWNSSSGHWEYNRSFEQGGAYMYNVSCWKGGYETSNESGVLEIVDTGLVVNCTSPPNATAWDSYVVNFTCNITDGAELKNISFYGNFSWEYPPRDSMVLWYHFNNDSSFGENNNLVYDFSGNDNNGTVSGTTVYSYGRFMNSSWFNGAGASINVSDSLSLNLSRDLTIEAWIKPKRNFFSNSVTIVDNGEFSLGLNYTNSLQNAYVFAFLNTTGSGWMNVSSGTSDEWTLGWHHIALTYNSSSNTTRIYRDGVILSEAVGNLNGTVVPRAQDLIIGFGGSDSFFGSIDELAIYNETLNSTEIMDHFAGRWQEFAYDDLSGTSDISTFLINTIYRGYYEWDAYACNILGLCRWDPPKDTETLFLNSTAGEGRGGGIDPSYYTDNYINVTPDDPNTNHDIDCNSNFSWNGFVEAYVYWYLATGSSGWTPYNFVRGWYYDISGGYIHQSLLDTLGNSYTSFNDSIRCLVIPGNGFDEFPTLNDSVIINNSLPVVELYWPLNDSHTTNRTPLFIWNVTDEDSDDFDFEFNITRIDSGAPGDPCVDPRNNNIIIDDNSTNYTLEDMLKCFSNAYYYEWKVRASDDGGNNWGDWSESWGVWLDSEISINLVRDTIDFGLIAYDGENDTTDDNPLPFLIENNGNVEVNITLNGTSLWNTKPNPTSNFTYKIDWSSEVGAFDWGLSTTTFTPVPAANNPTKCVSYFNWSDVNDSAIIDLYIAVPGVDEGPGTRTSTIQFSASMAN